MKARTLRWSSTSPDDAFDVENPATGEVIATIQGSGPEQVDAAVRAAHAAYVNDWRWRPGRERGAMLMEVARRIRCHAEEIAALEVSDNGKTLAQSRQDVDACIMSFDFFGGLAGKIPGNAFDGGPVYGLGFLEPYGVVAGIIPFNWPPIHTGAKIAPALAVGNTIVVKPPEQAPLSILRIIEIIQEVLPADVVQVVTGRGATGAALVSHKLVRKISFTGSPVTGSAVLKACADNHTPCLMELGGKNAFIIMDDADLDLALKGALEAGYVNQGEACTAGSRLLVHDRHYDEAADRMARAVERIVVGSGMDPTTQLGPLIDAKQRDRVVEYIGVGLQEGATIAAQGSLSADPALANGYFVPPTLFTGVERHMRIAREEIFGPVVSMIRFSDAEEAVSIANDTDFGLTAAIYSSDHAKALAMGRQIDVGIVFINNYFRGIIGMPFGGTKASGYGREHSVDTLREFGRMKVMTMPSGLVPVPAWGVMGEI